MTNTGIITKQSQLDFESTYQKLRSIIDGNPNLKIILEMNHQANAAKAGLELRPTKLIVFGNPNLGTPLMQSALTLGLDLPQKVLVTKSDEGAVSVSYNDPAYLKERHGISGNDEVLAKVTGALDKITTGATTA